MPPAIGRVITQARRMLTNRRQLTFSRERKRPTQTTEPTLQCVVEIGSPNLLAIRTVNAEPISIATPLKWKTNFINVIVSKNNYFVHFTEFRLLNVHLNQSNFL